MLIIGKSSRGLAANMLDSSLDLSEFESQSRYYVHFRTNAHLGKVWIPHSHYCSIKDSFGIK